MTKQTDATLQQRCAEIVEWQRTGVLPGTALRTYAAEHWADHHYALQMAERDTSARAMELIAKWGTPTGVGEPVGYCHEIKWRAHQSEQVQKITRKAQPEHGYIQALYTTTQPVPASRILSHEG